MTPIARTLRRDATAVEAFLWQRLRNRQIEGAKFVRQFPIGPYVVDFACRAARLVIELDGGQHIMSTADDARTEFIEAGGLTVVRFWNNDVTENLEAVLEVIAAQVRLARNS
ncbi:MAG: endonuclease domain-containing protein [Sphingomonadaceae bacterium]|nr:endonuclease domain-containing protein [Sphingomonadaceae bacterium]